MCGALGGSGAGTDVVKGTQGLSLACRGAEPSNSHPSAIFQETLVNLAGLLVSLLMLPLVSDCPSFSLGCFFLLTALHVYANYRAVRALVIETLNEGRLWLVLKHFLQRGEVLDPTSANQMEPLWTGFWPSLSLSLGVPLHRLVSSVVELQQLAEGHQEPYLLRWDQSQSKCLPP